MVGSASAVLPPLYQSLAELKSIITDPRLGQVLESGELIKEISRTSDGYVIVTNHHELPVKVIFKKNAHPGPAQFTIEFEELRPVAGEAAAQTQ